ncbi:hypothetical protein Q3V23_03730 [Streptomyces sp. VNUA116]|uniref:hypothetical protein n=1 Tax=Streptomyces sp. VNUA116 TaxID=3062449 RepID=UPI002674FA96|nr:hypothetical protein [Streptomyces sp. VNUA116]WKU43257.1 hypothetical protein Q3V23_03730 [Streptomyces sp. VNUA116]
MAARDDHGLATRRAQPKSTRVATQHVHPAFERFLRAVRADIESRLTPDVVQERLRRLTEPAATAPAADRTRSAGAARFESRAGWAAYGYHVIRLWLLAIAATGSPRPRLRRNDVDELAVETVARALSSFRDQELHPLPEPRTADAALKAAFLTECVRHLPYVNRSLRLMTEQVSFEEFEDTDDIDLVGALWDCATTGRAEELRRAARDAGGEGEGEGDADEIVTLTPIAIRSAVQRYPEAVTPGSIA